MESKTLVNSEKWTDAQIKKNIIWNTIGISSHSLYGVVIMIIVARINGLEVMGGFSFAFYFASIFFAIGMYGGKIYQISDIKNEFTNSNYVSQKIASSLLMLIAALVFCLLNGYETNRILLILIFLAYRMFESVSEAYFGVMERNGRLDLTGKSRSFKILIGLGGFVVINSLTMNIYIASMAFVLSYGLVLVFYERAKVAKFDTIVIRFERKILELFKKCFSVFIFAFLTLLILNVSRYFVDIFLGDQELAIFNIIVMPTAIMALFIQFIFQPFMMELTFALKNKEYKKYRKKVVKLFTLLSVIGFVAASVAFLIGIPVLSFIYAVDLSSFRGMLVLMVVSGIAGGGSVAFSMLLTLMRKLNIQIALFTITLMVGVLTSILLIPSHGIYGAFIGVAITNIVQMILFSIGYCLMNRSYCVD